MDAGVQATQATDPQRNKAISGDHPQIHRKPAGRKPRSLEEVPAILDLLMSVTRHCWPELNRWLNELPDPRFEPMCRYSGAHLWWQVIMTFLTRGGSRNAFDEHRNAGALPENIQRICGQLWELEKNNPDKIIRLKTYQAKGGAKGLLRNYINDELDHFSTSEKNIASYAFDHLVSRRGTKMPHTVEDLAQLINKDEKELKTIFEKLTEKRILRSQQRAD